MLKQIAEAIRETRTETRTIGGVFALGDAAIAISLVIANHDEDFDRAGFLIDCGLDPDCKAVLEAKKET